MRRLQKIIYLESLEDFNALTRGEVIATSRGYMTYEGKFLVRDFGHEEELIGLLARESTEKREQPRLYEINDCSVKRGVLVIRGDHLSPDLLHGGAWTLAEEQEDRRLKEAGLWE